MSAEGKTPGQSTPRGVHYRLYEQPYYLPWQADVPQTSHYVCEYVDGEPARVMVISANVVRDIERQLLRQEFDIETMAQDFNAALVNPRALLPFTKLQVPKPWGQEIWYSGVEQRGVCAVQTASGDCPLPQLKAGLNQHSAGLSDDALILLKVLDPHPEPVLGDLYFELHERKQEVYVITAVAESAWPEGVGQIRIGFNPDRLAEYATEKEFKQAYRQAVKKYRAVRVEIDAWLEQHRAAAVNSVDLELRKAALADVPADLQARERELRDSMDSFTQTHALRVGDVVVIPRYLPHSLQHGVRAVEFQTPVYERKIVSFAQKVLTQAHWDTDEALALTRIEQYHPPAFPSRLNGACSEQKIVDFDEFEVWRSEVPAHESLTISDDGGYAMLMVISGKIRCGDCVLGAEQAGLLTRLALPMQLHNEERELAQLLIARPHR